MKKISVFVSAVATLGVLIFSTNRAIAGQHLDEVAPNGWSPWYYLETWRVTNGYNSGSHIDAYNDYYALDFSPVSGNACNRPVYPAYNNMTVVYVDKDNYGRIDLTTTINGVAYKIKYLHLSSIIVAVGAVVGSDHVIGYTGNKQTSACHLHMNVQKKVDGTWYGIKPKFCQTIYSYVGQQWLGC